LYSSLTARPAAASTTASQSARTRPDYGNSTNPAGPSRTQSSSGEIITTGTIVATVVCLTIGIIGAAAIYWSLIVRSRAGHAPYTDKLGVAEPGAAIELDVITAAPQSRKVPHAGAVEVPGVPGNRA
jgi:hypothetical protein